MFRPLLAALSALRITTPCVPQKSPPPKPTTETFAIEGRVVDMRGEGVPTAKVQVMDRRTPDTTIAKTVADGDGHTFDLRVPTK